MQFVQATSDVFGSFILISCVHVKSNRDATNQYSKYCWVNISPTSARLTAIESNITYQRLLFEKIVTFLCGGHRGFS